ncbi:hematopoietic prostaglandin D synthase-like [Strongylocentrotus purpuratus]|uniref:GST N-terminal domain-containing protein n=1 Tax=Strongylocentrotus purpuratus TaxID=7668 RepID=A0A7M7NSA0_STRPU|nr:hematopoietic prostaglandin D synthase-like [Strongylocentrotus purpuratus]
MPSYKLIYFPDRFRTEVCRLLFVLAEVEFDDHRVDYMEWSTKLKKCSNAPYGDLPILEIESEEGKIILPQSRAIQRYLAKEFGLYGESNDESVIIDVVTECWDEFLDAAAKIMFEEEQTKKASLADVATFNYIDVVKDWVGEELFSSYPKLLAIRDNISKIESIAAYLAGRPKCLY